PGLFLSLAILLIAFFSKNRKLHSICMGILCIMLLSTGLLITLVSAPEQLTVTLIPVALLVPLFFDVKPIVFVSAEVITDLIYLIFAPMVKPADILVLDIVDVLAFSISGILIGTIITKVKIERYVYASKIRKIALQDGLTECFNRKAYVDDTKKASTNYPEDYVYVSMDVNGLKIVNDTLGHEAGDELILGASQCMIECFGKFGKVYRTGGDEFTAILKIGKEKIENIINDFEKEVDNWHGKIVENTSVSCGYATADEIQGLSIDKVSVLADKRMYEKKAAFYKEKGMDRRGQADAHKALCNLYTKILKINITDDTYSIVNMDVSEQTKEKGFSESISKWLYSFGKSGLVHPDDIEEYLRYTNVDYMREYFAGNKTSLHIFYRRKFEDDFKQVMMEIIPADDYSNDNQVLFLYVKNIEK
ncbi:MAG: diguanylate cyclase, partial [Clostridia bacterium]|nr:diguanylate cyclase [Clostridia bacterium]